jgi:methyltransferase (TIGR00027 family)
MERKSPSKTAEDIAGFRALEMLRPEEERVCEDPYAKHFLTGSWVGRVHSPFRAMLYQWVVNRINPGAPSTVPARVRFIDEYIKQCHQNGLQQLLILGAGYDSRAYRIDELKTGVMVFEVDHPATQDFKKEVLATVLEKSPDNLFHIPYILGNEGFEEKLLNNGFDNNKKSLFVMEGLIMYLDPETVKNLFSLISRISCPGSSVVFDFLPPGIEDGTISSRGGRNMHKWAQEKGEPFKFGIDQDQLITFLTPLGFDDITVINAQQSKDLYFKGKSSTRPVSPLFSFAHATVNQQ